MKVLERGYHKGPIADVSLSRWKPFVMTLGPTDRSVRLWNFETKKLVMFLEFPNDIYASSLHPTGKLIF